MPDFFLSPLARKDLAEIFIYIARGSIKQADIVLDEFYEAFEKLANMPYMGSKREELPAFRFWVLHSYLIIYNPENNPIEVTRIISAYRDIDTILN